MAPQPPLTSTTAMSVAAGKAEARAPIKLSSAADFVWRLIGLLWKHLNWRRSGVGILMCVEELRLLLDEDQCLEQNTTGLILVGRERV